MFQRSKAASFRRGRAAPVRIESLENRSLLSVSIAGNTETFTAYAAPRSAHEEPTARPSITRTEPADGATNITRDAFIAAYLQAGTPGAGVETSSLTNATALLYITGDTTKTQIPAIVNTTGGGDAIILTPSSPLAANTQYTFEVTDGVKDTAGASFIPYTSTFTTGTAGGIIDTSIAFSKVVLPNATGQQFSSLTIGPDGKLYAGTMDGKILRFDIHSDGQLAAPTVFNVVRTNNGNQSRIILGLAFDPASTPANPILWITHNHGELYGAPDWTSKLSRVSGINFNQYTDYIVGLPRSARDHMAMKIEFSPAGKMYFAVGSNNGMGAPDDFWGDRSEQLMSGNILEVDTAALDARIAAGQGALNVKTVDGGTYDPYATDAPVTIYATGVRNAYDLLWHSNGFLYAPTNGSAPGSGTPAGPGIPAISNNLQTEPDWLFRVREGKYYGHPNPSQGHYVLNGGNPTSGSDKFQVDAYPVGVQPDALWDPAVFNFGNNRSPNGVIEYKSDAFNGVLKGSMLITRYSGGDDIIILKPDSGGNIPSTGVKTAVSGLTSFSDPLDLVEVVGPGNLYLIEYKAMKITLLKPTTVSTPPPDPGPAITGLTLYNAVTDKPIGPLENYPSFSFADLGATKLTIKAETSGTIGSVRWGFDIDGNYKIEGSAPFAIAGDDNSNYRPFELLTPGTHTITVTAYSAAGAGGAVIGMMSRTFTITAGTSNPPPGPNGPLTGLTLINAVNDTPFGPAENYPTINLSVLGTSAVTFKAEVTGAIGSIRWGFDGNANYKVEGSAPYSINGDDNSNFRPFSMQPGHHTIIATAYSGAGATGAVLGTVTRSFDVVAGTETPPPPPPGNVLTGLTLLNAVNDTAYGPAENYPTINLSELGTTGVTFKAEVTGSVGSIRWGYDGNANFKVEGSAPYSINGDDNKNFRPFAMTAGTHTITATAYSGAGATGTVLGTITRTFTVVAGTGTPPLPPVPPTGNRITGLTLYNANNDTAFGAAENYPQISLATLGTSAITFKAEIAGTVASIRWGLDGNANYRVENSAPFSVNGDDNGNFRPFTIAKGVHTLTATAYASKDGKGTVLNTLSLTFEVI
jgi:hypothetical protein